MLQHRHYKSERVAARGQDDHKADDVSESDWGKEYEQAYHNGGWSAVDPLTLNPGQGWKVNNPMPDKLYLGVIKTLLADEPEVYLDTLKTSDPLLHKVIERQLLNMPATTSSGLAPTCTTRQRAPPHSPCSATLDSYLCCTAW